MFPVCYACLVRSILTGLLTIIFFEGNKMIAGQRNSDLTEGIIWKTLIIFTVPILVGNFFQHLYTTADAVIVGRFTGKEGLAAIDSIFSLLRLPVNLFSGLSAGSSILISQL